MRSAPMASAPNNVSDTRGRSSSWAPLLDALGQHRIVVVGYLLVLTGWLVLVILTGFVAIPEVFHQFLGAGRDWSINDDLRWSGRAVILGGFLSLQALFLWGGGRVRLRRRRVSFRRVAVSLAI